MAGFILSFFAYFVLDHLCHSEFNFALVNCEVRSTVTPLGYIHRTTFLSCLCRVCSYTQILQIGMQLSLTFLKSRFLHFSFSLLLWGNAQLRKRKYNCILSLLSQEVSMLHCFLGLFSWVINVSLQIYITFLLGGL